MANPTFTFKYEAVQPPALAGVGTRYAGVTSVRMSISDIVPDPTGRYGLLSWEMLAQSNISTANVTQLARRTGRTTEPDSVEFHVPGTDSIQFRPHVTNTGNQTTSAPGIMAGFKPYARPLLSGLRVFRANADGTANMLGTSLRVAGGTITYSISERVPTLRMYYRQKYSNTWIDAGYRPLTSSGSNTVQWEPFTLLTGGASTSVAWEVRFEANDVVSINGVTHEVGLGGFIQSIDTSKNAIAFGGPATKGRTLEIYPAMDLQVRSPAIFEQMTHIPSVDGKNFENLFPSSAAASLGTIQVPVTEEWDLPEDGSLTIEPLVNSFAGIGGRRCWTVYGANSVSGATAVSKTSFIPDSLESYELVAARSSSAYNRAALIGFRGYDVYGAVVETWTPNTGGSTPNTHSTMHWLQGIYTPHHTVTRVKPVIISRGSDTTRFASVRVRRVPMRFMARPTSIWTSTGSWQPTGTTMDRELVQMPGSPGSAAFRLRVSGKARPSSATNGYFSMRLREIQSNRYYRGFGIVVPSQARSLTSGMDFTAERHFQFEAGMIGTPRTYMMQFNSPSIEYQIKELVWTIELVNGFNMDYYDDNSRTDNFGSHSF